MTAFEGGKQVNRVRVGRLGRLGRPGSTGTTGTTAPDRIRAGRPRLTGTTGTTAFERDDRDNRRPYLSGRSGATVARVRARKSTAEFGLGEEEVE
jgi:hypothetical protein